MTNATTHELINDKTNYRFFAFNILKAKGKALFANNKALLCLSKSDSFFKELTNTLSGLWENNITPEKFESVIKSLQTSKTDIERLLLIARLYTDYVEIMNKSGYTLPKYLCISKSLPHNKSNAEIQQRIQYISDTFLSSAVPADKDNLSSKSVCYLEFSDIQNETLHIINEIKSLVETGQAQYTEIAVFIDRTEARKKFIDLVKARNLPVISSIYNEDYENLKNKISIYHKISELFLELEMEEFSYEEMKNIKLHSKAQKEICFEELDEIFKTLLTEILKNQKTTDRLFTSCENKKKTSAEMVFALWNSFDEEDKAALSAEFNSLKSFYEEFKNKKYAKAIESLIKKNLSKFQTPQLKETVIGKIKSLNDLQNLFQKLEMTEPDFESFKEIIQGLPKDKEKEKNSIYLASITSDLKKLQGFKYLYIAGLTQNNFPSQNTSYPFISEQTNKILCEQLKKISKDYDSFLRTDNIHFEQRLSDFCAVMSLAKNKLTLTTHTYEAKKQTQPSVFFKVLSDWDKNNFLKIQDSDSTDTKEKTADLPAFKQEYNSVITEDDILRLNPSAISTFQKCPRKYYYKNLLNLKEPYTFCASYGSIVHAVFQVLNTNFKHNYNKKMALALAKVLFNSTRDEQRALQAGFSQTDTELVKAASELSLEEMKDNFNDAIEDFCLSGGFDNPPIECVCEKSFSFKIKEIPNVVFDGRIDALMTYPDGTAKVIDYKTGKDKTNTLEYAVSDYGVNFKLKTGKDPSNTESLQKAYDYQIPIYFLACQNSAELDEFKDKISSLGLVYIRPKSKDNGCNEDFVSAQKIEEYKDKIIQNLKETVIDKILNETEFPKTKSWDCDSCAYKFLCDREDE